MELSIDNLIEGFDDRDPLKRVTFGRKSKRKEISVFEGETWNNSLLAWGRTQRSGSVILRSLF